MFGMVGWMFKGFRAGDKLSVWNRPELQCETALALSSAAFTDGAPIPRKHAGPGEGDNLAPPMAWSRPPRKTRELLLMMEDVDVPLPRPLIHTAALVSARLPSLPEGGWNRPSEEVVLLPGGYGGTAYAGPLPIPGHGAHHYRFMLFALDCSLRGSKPALSIDRAIAAANGHVLARGLLTGTYERN